MPTLIHVLTASVPASALSLPLVTNEEKALIARSDLLGWWRADSGFGVAGGGWRDGKNDALVSLSSGNLPVYSATGGANGKPMVTSSSCQFLAAVDSTILPASTSFTFVLIGRLSSGQTLGIPFGNSGSTVNAGFYTGAVPRLYVGGTNIGTGTASTYANGVKMFCFSYRRIASNNHEGCIRVNGSNGTLATSTNTLSWTDQRLSLLLANAYAFNGEVMDMMLFSVPLHHSDGIDSRVAAENYAHTRYALTMA